MGIGLGYLSGDRVRLLQWVSLVGIGLGYLSGDRVRLY